MTRLLEGVDMGDCRFVALFYRLFVGHYLVHCTNDKEHGTVETPQHRDPVGPPAHFLLVPGKGLRRKTGVPVNDILNQPGMLLTRSRCKKIRRGLTNERRRPMFPDEFDTLPSRCPLFFTIGIGRGMKETKSLQPGRYLSANERDTYPPML